MTTDAVGGVWTYAMELARAALEHDCEFILACMGPAPSRQQREEAARLENVRLYTAGFRLEWMDDPWEDVDAPPTARVRGGLRANQAKAPARRR